MTPFDIRDPLRPREIAYFNQSPPVSEYPTLSGSYAMSAPAFAPERGEVWYSDTNSGFYNVRQTVRAKQAVVTRVLEQGASYGRGPAAQSL